jgi:YbbR domain-containing protein
VVVLRRDWVVLGEGTGLSVESFSPASVRVFLEPARGKWVPVAIRTDGVLPSGLALANPIGWTPTRVRVRGPASRVEELDSVWLRPLQLDQVRGSGVIVIPFDTTSLGGLHVEPMSATVGIRVDEKIERVITGVPVIALVEGDGSTIQVDPAVVSVTLRGASSLVTSVDPADLQAWVAPELLEDLTLDETRRVDVRVDGVPNRLIVVEVTEEVLVRRVAQPDPPGGLTGA